MATLMHKRFLFLAVASLIVASMSWSQAQQPTTAPTTRKAFNEIITPHLHNAHIVTAKVISGAQPEGEESFRVLRDLGVKTIISVDGAAPDVEGAKKYGMEYVHIPMTYNTVTDAQGKAIAKAIDEKPGKIYVHCHHGRHRSAAAVAVACVLNGQLQPEQAESVLQTFGTGANYTGLWKVVRETRPMNPQALKDLDVKFVPAVKPAGLTDAMVHIDEYSDHLKETQAAGWKAPPTHPDLDPAHEALQLQEHLYELGRTEATQARPANFRTLLTQNEEAVKALRAILVTKPVDVTAANAAMTKVTQSCTACHKAFRD